MSKKGISLEKAKEIRANNGYHETKLQIVRVNKGLSQKELSVIAGVPLRTIQCYEQQTRHIDTARLKTLCDLCIALNAKVSDILEDEILLERYNITR